MATLIPSIGAAQFDTRGELRLAERLKDFLEDNSYIWHNLAVGPRGRHTRGVEDRVQVRTFHSCCHQMLKTYGILGPSQKQHPDYNERLAALVCSVEAETLLGDIPGGQCVAVLINVTSSARRCGC